MSSNIIIQLSQKIVSSIQERVRFGTKYSVFTHTHRRRCVPSFPLLRTEIHSIANYAHVQHQRGFFVSVFFVCFSKYLYFLRVLLLRTCYSYFVVFHSYSFLRFAFLSVGFMCLIFDFLVVFFFFSWDISLNNSHALSRVTKWHSGKIYKYFCGVFVSRT